MTESLPRQHRQSLGYPWGASLTLPPLPPGVTAPTMLPHVGISLSCAPEPAWGHEPSPPTKLVCAPCTKQNRNQGHGDPILWEPAISVGMSLFQQLQIHTGVPVNALHSCKLCSCFSPCCKCWGSRGVPGVSWNRWYLLPFIFQGRSAPWAELGKSHPWMGLCSRRAPRGQRGTSHAQELLVAQRQGQANPLMRVTMRFDGEQEFVLQSCRF